MSITPYVGGNWKMNLDRAGSVSLARSVRSGVDALATPSRPRVDVFVPFPFLLVVAGVLDGGPVGLGAQDVYFEASGAYTGEVSVAMLKDCGVRSVLAGHSERRHVIGENDELIARKVRAVVEGGLDCVLCIGETLRQREAGETDRVNERQLRTGLAGLNPEQMSRITIAYEPVWAIGTGRTATPDDAQDAHGKVRGVLSSMFGPPTADRVCIQYGGSVKATNAAELFKQPDINGGLIGGASLNAADFLAICSAASLRR